MSEQPTVFGIPVKFDPSMEPGEVRIEATPTPLTAAELPGQPPYDAGFADGYQRGFNEAKALREDEVTRLASELTALRAAAAETYEAFCLRSDLRPLGVTVLSKLFDAIGTDYMMARVEGRGGGGSTSCTSDLGGDRAALGEAQ